jgi:two-component system KDP operon response regulator KdpE
MARVLLVNHEPQLARSLSASLSAHRYQVAAAADGAAALRAAAQHLPDLVILDLALPDMDGVAVIAGLRRWLKAPILALTGQADEVQTVQALDAGADDCVTKPFCLEELLARLRALQRRAETETGTDQPVVLIGYFSIDLAAKTVTRRPDAPDDGPQYAHLTKTEWALLEILVRAPGRLVPGRLLLERVWGAASASETNNLRFHLAKLRQKLEPEPSRPRQLLTEPGRGYRFQP